MVKILHVNDYRTAGGTEVLVEQMISLQRRRNLEVSLFTIEDVPGYRRTPLSYVSSRQCCRCLRARLDAFQPDVVHLHNFYHVLSPAILATLGQYRRRQAARIVMTAHDHHLVCPNSGMRFFNRDGWRLADPDRLPRWSYLLSRRWDHRGWLFSLLKVVQHVWHYRLHRRHLGLDIVFSPSRFLAGLLEERGCRTMVVPHPIPSCTVDVAKATGSLHMVFAGRVEPEKGLAEFLAVMSDDADQVLTVVGDGSDLSRCRRICRERGLEDRVAFVGRQSRDATMRAIARAHLLILPSLVYETAGLTLLEALALKTNILTSALAGTGEIVRDTGIGFTFVPGDRASLQRAMKQVHRAFHRGELDNIDVSDVSACRSEERFIDRMCDAYTELP